MNSDEWKTFWKNKDHKNALNSFFIPNCKISYDEERQEMNILNFQVDSNKRSSHRPHRMEQDFFGKNRINKEDNQCGPIAFGKNKKETYKIWSGLEILNPHSLPAEDWNP